MSFKLSPFMMAAAAGVLTATVVAYATIQSQTIPSVPEKVGILPSTVTASDMSPTLPPVEPVVIRPPTANCAITMAVVTDPNPPLNVRSTPKVQPDNIVGQLDNQTFVSVVEQSQGWLKIRDPLTGWIAQNRTRSSCSNVLQPLNLSTRRPSVMIQGEIIGGGSHRYTFQGNQGQTLTVSSNTAIFPNIIQPDGQPLVNRIDSNTSGETWNGTLPITGTYTLELNSNFRGFQYDFLVKIED